MHNRVGGRARHGTADEVARGLRGSPRRVTRGAREVGDRISVSEAQPGDIVGCKTGGGNYSHAGIYLGDGRLIDASGSRGYVLERSMWGSSDWVAVSYR